MKRNIINITILFVGLSCLGCSTTKEHTKYRFRKEEFNLQIPTILRTDGVYLTKISTSDTSKYFYQFIKFYNNGRCFYSVLLDHNPTHIELKKTSLDLGERTYFRNDGNKFTIEVWANYYVGYMCNIGIADINSILIDRYKVRGLFFVEKEYEDFLQKEYKFIPFGSENIADW